MRPRFEITDGRNSFFSSMKRGEHAKNLQNVLRSKHQVHEKQTLFPSDYQSEFAKGNSVEDGQQAGIIQMKLFNGKRPLEGQREIVIGGRQMMTDKEGGIRIVSKEIANAELNRLAEIAQFHEAVLGACLSDPTGSITRYLLPKSSYDALAPGEGKDYIGGEGNYDREVLAINGKPQFFLNYPPSSTTYANALTKLRLVISSPLTSLMLDEDITDWISKFSGPKLTFGVGGGMSQAAPPSVEAQAAAQPAAPPGA